MTPAQRDILTHALGLNYTSTLHRNHYSVAPWCRGFADVQALVDAGLMEKGRDDPNSPPGYACYHVTPVGAAAVGAGLSELEG